MYVSNYTFIHWHNTLGKQANTNENTLCTMYADSTPPFSKTIIFGHHFPDHNFYMNILASREN